MKAIYIYSRTENNMEISGEAKKAKMQKRALEKNGIECEIFYHPCYKSFNKFRIRMPFIKIYDEKFAEALLKKIDGEINSIYFRKYIFDRSFIDLLKKIKQKKKEIKIIIEIPTYPYDLEWSSFIDAPLLLKDKKYRKELYKYVDRIVTFSNDKNIFNITCIKTSNGIDCSIIKKRIPQNVQEDTINMLGVAYVERWHGYDRILSGLANYYKNKNIGKHVIFHIVGDGSEIKNLKKMCRKLNIEKYVVFYGALHGQELDNMFNRCNVGIGSLGMHRIGLADGYTLKLREYAARGIPFIYGYNDALMEKHNLRYMMKVDNNDSDIDITKIVRFCDDIYKEDGDIIAENMSRFAQNYLTWNQQMKPIAEYMLEV